MTKGNSVLGHRVRDIITGLEGVAVGHVTYISGCSQVLISPGLDKDGKMHDSSWVDEQRIETTHPPDQKIELDNTETPGFDQEAPKQ